jgi:Tol biopolymer transport system component
MKAQAVALIVTGMLTIDQQDTHRTAFDRRSVSVSADGRYIAFLTCASLAGADTDRTLDVYLLDRARQRVSFESAACGPADCQEPDISADGRYLVFQSGGAIVWRDTVADVDRILGEGRQPSLTGNGIVVFTAETDVYLVDPRGGVPRRVNPIDLPGIAGPAWSFSPSASADGRYVAFAARPPVEGRRIPGPQVFVRDMLLGTTRRIGNGWTPSMSGDGSALAFVGPDDGGLSHIHVVDLRTNAVRIITKSVKRGLANGASISPAISANGRFVVFQSEASDLVAGEDINLLWDVFVYDREQGTTMRVSGDPDGAWIEPSVGPSIDGAGSVIAFSSRHPTGSTDEANDFDLYVATLGSLTEDQKIKR